MTVKSDLSREGFPHGLLCTHTLMGPVFLSCFSLHSLLPLPRSVLLGLAAVPLTLLCPFGSTQGRHQKEVGGEQSGVFLLDSSLLRY